MAAAQTVVPPEVKTSAIVAVEALGDQLVLGHNRMAIDRMYPQWKERMAKRMGGIEKLEQQLEGIGAVMARNGVSLISVRVEGEPKAYEVELGEDGGFRKWLLLVPTTLKFRIVQPGDPPTDKVLKSHGFQVAIADKAQLDWTFINGSDVSVAELRSLFINLPANMELPAVRREVDGDN